MSRKLVSRVMIFAVLLTLLSCPNSIVQPENLPTPAPLLRPRREIQLADNVQPLTPENAPGLISISEDQTELLFTADSKTAADLAEGDVLAMGITELAPFGMLRKVTGVIDTGEGLKVETEPAALEEAIKSGTLSYSGPAPLGEAALPRLSASRGLSHTEEGIYMNFEEIVFYENGNFRVTLSGGIWIDPWIDFLSEIDNSQIKYLHFISNLKISSKLIFEAKFVEEITPPALPVYLSLNKTTLPILKEILPAYPSFEFRLPTPIPIPIAPGIVVPFFVTLKPVVGLEGELYVGVKTEVTHVIEGTTGIVYDGNVFTPFAELNNEFAAEPLALTAGANLKAYAGIELGLKAYKYISGPYLFPHAYLQLEADIFDTPWWKLYAGRELSGGFRPGIFFISLFDWQFPLSFGSRQLLLEAQAPPPVLRGCLEGNVRDSRDASSLADVNITVYSGACTPGAPVYTSGTTDPAGGYQLPIQEGEDYSVRFARTGYLDVILNGIAIRNFNVTCRDVIMVPEDGLIRAFELTDPETYLDSMYSARLLLNNPNAELYTITGQFQADFIQVIDRDGNVAEQTLQAYLDPYNLGIGVEAFESHASEIRFNPGLDSYTPVSRVELSLDIRQGGQLIDSLRYERHYPAFRVSYREIYDEYDAEENRLRTVHWRMYNPGGVNYDLDFRCNIEGIERSICTNAGSYTFSYYTPEENYEIELLFSYQGREIDRITYSNLGAG